MDNKRIKTRTQKLDGSGNVFFRSVQEFYCNQPNHFPKRFYRDYDDIVLGNVVGWKITGRRIRAGAQEIDLSIANISLDNELWQLGAYVLVECKNWSTHVDIHQIRNIAHISAMKGNKTAILFASNGITADAQEEIQRLTASNLSIVCITASDLRQLYSAEDCRLLILKRWRQLQNTTELSALI